MLLAIDCGNTEVKLGVFDGERLAQTWRIATDPRKTPDEYAVLVRALFSGSTPAASEVDAVAIASVVPKLDPVLAALSQALFGVDPQYLRPGEQTAIAMRTALPAESGADLVAAAIGCVERHGAPAIVVSYGTATVFVAIAPDGAYAGVAIAPGITVSIDALIGRTAKLPQVALQAPVAAIGRTTEAALQAGIVYGFAGQTVEVVRRMRAELGGAPKVVATGGLAATIAPHVEAIDAVDPHLSLFGLRRFHARGRAASSPVV